MTTLIPDTWELPSYLAGDLVHMDKYRDRGVRETLPDADENGSWEQDAEVVTHPKWRIRRGPSAPSEPTSDWSSLGEIEPYDPTKHGPYEPADLVSVDSHQALTREGFEPVEHGTWQRRVHHENGNPTGFHHILTYEPGNRLESTNERAPWVLTTDPDTVGTAFRSVDKAISAANADRDQVRKMSRLGSFLGELNRLFRKEAVEKTPAQLAAEKWLEDNPEGFEEWHPERERATPGENYSDFMDPAGQTFHDDEEHGRSHVMPGSHYDWENPESELNYSNDDSSEDEENERYMAQMRPLENEGFEWQHRGDPSRTPVGEYQAGEWVKQQHDPEGHHIATHTIHWNPHTLRWNLESTDPSDSNFAYHSSAHGSTDDAVDMYRQKSSEAVLPRYGYEPHRGRTGWITHWTKSTPAPEGSGHMEDYQHEIFYPEEGGGFMGQTFNNDMAHNNFASNGAHAHHSHDLDEVIREQERLGRGEHPGGVRDQRLTREQLLSDPSVARLGQPSYVSDNFYGDGRVGSAHWHFPHPEGSEHPVHAEATYNWGKGGYDFKYTHDGTWLAASHNAVPAGAPTHVPGRQLTLPLESAR